MGHKPKRNYVKRHDDDDSATKYPPPETISYVVKIGDKSIPVKKIPDVLSAYYKHIHRSGWRLLDGVNIKYSFLDEANINYLFSIDKEGEDFSLTFVKESDKLKIIGQPKKNNEKVSGYYLLSDQKTDETRKLDELIKS